ncbi:MAG TPA: LLM class flavin-dependent oxidoreductase [Acidimicrobiales bacterium]|nr:LLM class flavin-dependent oxidoreductase [Acidimicrobiales bacterium]
MRFGIYSDMRNPPQWRRPWPDVYRRGIEVAVNAEAAGADVFWLSEHHFFEDGYLSQPLTFAAAVASRTSRIRLGTAVLLAPLRRALQIAEEAAVVDLVSDGRMELGLGAGYRLPEFEAFGADMGRRFADTDERAVEIRRLYADGVVSPPPVQDPMPIWLGYASPAGARRAGRLGFGLLAMSPELAAAYLEGLDAGGHDRSSARMAGNLNFFLADDPEAAWARIKDHLGYQVSSYQRYAVEGTGAPVPEPVDPETIRTGEGAGQLTPRFHVLTVDQAEAHVRRAVGTLPVTDIFVWSSIAGLDDDLVDRHVELVSRDLRQRFA